MRIIFKNTPCCLILLEQHCTSSVLPVRYIASCRFGMTACSQLLDQYISYCIYIYCISSESTKSTAASRPAGGPVFMAWVPIATAARSQTTQQAQAPTTFAAVSPNTTSLYYYSTVSHPEVTAPPIGETLVTRISAARTVRLFRLLLQYGMGRHRHGRSNVSLAEQMNQSSTISFTT